MPVQPTELILSQLCYTWQGKMLLLASLENSFWTIQIPFSKEVKHWALGISVFLFLIAICILIWQIQRYCTQLTAPQHAGTFDWKPHN